MVHGHHEYAHVEGIGTQSTGEASHVQGKYNTDGNFAHVVGGGTSNDNRKNIHTLDWDGNAFYQGNVETTGVILKSPNGTKFKITVDDNGNLSTIKM